MQKGVYTKMSEAEYFKKYRRDGLLSPYNSTQRQNKNGAKAYCLACREDFDEWTDARTHPCPNEQEFRENPDKFKRSSGRGLGSRKNRNGPIISKIPQKEPSLEFDPEKFLEFASSILNERNELRKDNNLLKEENKKLSLMADSLKAQVDRLNEQIKRAYSVKIHNDLAQAYQETTRR